MNRLQNAQKQLAESLAALESAVERTKNFADFSASGNGTDIANSNANAEGSDALAHPASAIDLGQLSQDLTAIEADLETAINMIGNLTASGSSSGRDEGSL